MSNCTNNVPSSQELLAYMATDTSSIVLISFMCLFTLLILVMYIEALVYINRKVSDTRTQIRLKIILGIYPWYACSSLLALFIPRAHLITTLTATIFFSAALFQFMLLIISYFGGREQLLTKLEGYNIPVASPPLLCCCVCLPPVPVTGRNLIRLRQLVMQTAFIRPLCNLISLILWADGYSSSDLSHSSPFLWINLVSLVSSLCAMLGVIILMRLSDEHLASYRLRPKFLLIQLVIVVTILQNVIIGVIAVQGGIPCHYPLSAGARAYYYQDALVIVEMVAFSFLARFFFRRRIRKTPAGRDHPDHYFNNSIVKHQSESDVKVPPVTISNNLDTVENGKAPELTKYEYYNGNNNAKLADESHVNVGFDDAGNRLDEKSSSGGKFESEQQGVMYF